VGFRCVVVTGAPPGSVADETTFVVLPPAGSDNTSPRDRRQPRPIHQVEPDYPPDRKASNESGVVVVEFDIDETGRVRDPRVVSATHESFAAPTLAAVRDWRFEPAQREGREITCHALQQFNFNAQRPRALE
jgi:TonB family protein